MLIIIIVFLIYDIHQTVNNKEKKKFTNNLKLQHKY